MCLCLCLWESEGESKDSVCWLVCVCLCFPRSGKSPFWNRCLKCQQRDFGEVSGVEFIRGSHAPAASGRRGPACHRISGEQTALIRMTEYCTLHSKLQMLLRSQIRTAVFPVCCSLRSHQSKSPVKRRIPSDRLPFVLPCSLDADWWQSLLAVCICTKSESEPIIEKSSAPESLAALGSGSCATYAGNAEL